MPVGWGVLRAGGLCQSSAGLRQKVSQSKDMNASHTWNIHLSKKCNKGQELEGRGMVNNVFVLSCIIAEIE